MKRRITAALAVVLGCSFALVSAAGAAEATIPLNVTCAADAGENVPVSVCLDALPAALKGTALDAIHAFVEPSPAAAAVKAPLPAQLVPDGKGYRLWWVLPTAAKGTSTWLATLSTKAPAPKGGFRFETTEGKYVDMLFGGKLVTRYMIARDTSTKETKFNTAKVFQHVYDENGQKQLTKGTGGRYPHHRGIFIGWRKTVWGGKSYDTWHCHAGEALLWKKLVSTIEGPVVGRSVARIDWTTPNGKVILEETRTATAYRQPAPAILLLDFHTQLKAANGPVELSGDPEHAGMQYRPHNDVNSNKGDKATQYEFPADGIKTGGQKLNHNKDLPWAAECYALNGTWYNVQHMNCPDNPKGTVYSAYRPYGRFGAFPKAKLADGQTLVLQYRIAVGLGKMPSREELAERYTAFAHPPVVTVGK